MQHSCIKKPCYNPRTKIIQKVLPPHHVATIQAILPKIQQTIWPLSCLVVGYFAGRLVTLLNDAKHNEERALLLKNYILSSNVLTHVANKAGASLPESEENDIELEDHELAPCAVAVMGTEEGHSNVMQFTSEQPQNGNKHSWKQFVNERILPSLKADSVKKHLQDLFPSYLEEYIEELRHRPKVSQSEAEQTDEQTITQASIDQEEVIEAFEQEGVKLDKEMVNDLVDGLKQTKGRATWADIREAIDRGYENFKNDPARLRIREALTNLDEMGIYKIGIILMYLSFPFEGTSAIVSAFTTVMMVYMMLGHVSFAKTLHVPTLGYNGLTALRLGDILTHALAARHVLFYEGIRGIMWVPILLHVQQMIWHVGKVHEDLLMKVHKANVLDGWVYTIGVGCLFYCTSNIVHTSVLAGVGLIAYIVERKLDRVW